MSESGFLEGPSRLIKNQHLGRNQLLHFPSLLNVRSLIAPKAHMKSGHHFIKLIHQQRVLIIKPGGQESVDTEDLLPQTLFIFCMILISTFFFFFFGKLSDPDITETQLKLLFHIIVRILTGYIMNGFNSVCASVQNSKCMRIGMGYSQGADSLGSKVRQLRLNSHFIILIKCVTLPKLTFSTFQSLDLSNESKNTSKIVVRW